MSELVIPAGTLIHLYGMPLRVKNVTPVEGNPANFKTEPVAFVEYPTTEIVGPLEPLGVSEGPNQGTV